VRTLRALDLPTTHPLLADTARVAQGLDEFREHLGGRLTITLLSGVGAPVDVHSLDPALIERAGRLTAASS